MTGNVFSNFQMPTNFSTYTPAPKIEVEKEVPKEIQKEPEKESNVVVYEASRKEKIIQTAKKVAPIVIPLAAIPITALITYKLSTRNMNQLNDKLANLTQEISNMQSTIAKTGENIVKQSKEVSKLNDKIAKLAIVIGGVAGSYQVGKYSGQREEEKIQYYTDIAENTPLGYDPLNPPCEEYVTSNNFTKTFDFKPITPVSGKKADTFIQSLSNRLEYDGEINIPLIPQHNSEVQLQQASMDNLDQSMLQLGKELPIGINKKYGERTNWSNQKIARDIMQNFYDANEHSLDGVGISIKRDGKNYKVKISGNAVFDCKSLLELGSGTKLEDSLYNAGGFGEGSRLVVASLLGQDKSSQIKFASADWQLTFNEKENSILRKLERNSEVLDGNYIEFETEDDDFIQALVKSINFFEHSQNPDFQELDYDNKDFGFKILSPNEKGNLYITQRFEFGKDENWDNGVGGLNIIFRRKPDVDKFKSITGKEFSKGRDRLCCTNEDIFNLTKYFAQDLSDDELINTILTTSEHWGHMPDYNKDAPAIEYFINALCDVAQSRKLGIDFSDSKLCIKSGYSDQNVLRYIKSMGYTILSSGLRLDKIGMETTSEILKRSSNHKPLTPTETEKQKIKLLNEATGVIQRAIGTSYVEKLQELYNSVTDVIKVRDDSTRADIIKHIEEIEPDCDLVKKYQSQRISSFDGTANVFSRELREYLADKMQFAATQSMEENAKIAKIITLAIPYDKRNNEYSEKITQLENLELITPKDVSRPKYIYDRHNEISEITLGEAIIDRAGFNNTYKGHWIDRDYLNNGSFYDLLATWLHEISHKSGGDGTSEFTYKLTDLIQALLKAGVHASDMQGELSAIEKVFNNIK